MNEARSQLIHYIIITLYNHYKLHHTTFRRPHYDAQDGVVIIILSEVASNLPW